MNVADVDLELEELIARAQRCGAWAVGKEPPTDMLIQDPPRWQDLGKQMDPAYGYSPESTLMVVAGFWREMILQSGVDALIRVTQATNHWAAILWDFDVKFGNELEVAPPDTAADLEHGYRLHQATKDRLTWVGWATSTIARRRARASRRNL